MQTPLIYPVDAAQHPRVFRCTSELPFNPYPVLSIVISERGSAPSHHPAPFAQNSSAVSYLHYRNKEIR
jgi:hypothetical protein